MKHEEEQLQIACMKWLKYQYPSVLAIHVPNGGKRNAREGARFKAMGVMPGVADVLIFRRKLKDPNTINSKLTTVCYNGLAIELKSMKGKLQPSQIFFSEKICQADWVYSVCRTFEEFQLQVIQYLS